MKRFVALLAIGLLVGCGQKNLNLAVSGPPECSIVPEELPAPQPNLYAVEDDIRLGNELLQEIPREWYYDNSGRVAFFEDAVMEAYLMKILERLLAHTPDYARVYSYKFYFTSAEQFQGIMMTTLPGGIIIVGTDVLASAKSDDYLAGIEGHEIAHVALRHHTRVMTVERLLKLEREIHKSSDGYAKDRFSPERGMLRDEVIRRYRTGEQDEAYANERDADIWGAQVAHDAGYSLVSAIREFDNWSREEPRGSIGSDAHPPSILRAMVATCQNQGGNDWYEVASEDLLLVQKHLHERLGDS